MASTDSFLCLSSLRGNAATSRIVFCVVAASAASWVFFLCRSSLHSNAAASRIVFCVVATSAAMRQPHMSFFVSQQPLRRCGSFADRFLCRSSLGSLMGLFLSFPPWTSFVQVDVIFQKVNEHFHSMYLKLGNNNKKKFKWKGGMHNFLPGDFSAMHIFVTIQLESHQHKVDPSPWS